MSRRLAIATLGLRGGVGGSALTVLGAEVILSALQPADVVLSVDRPTDVVLTAETPADVTLSASVEDVQVMAQRASEVNLG
ncbi:MAG: hypothetical protein AAFN18_12005 [Cyanobacteria bacterium J06554_6]